MSRRDARTLHSRFALFDGKILLVSRKLNFNDLCAYLLEMPSWHRWDREKFLQRFGSDGEVNLRNIQQYSTSLRRWERALAECKRNSPFFRERTTQRKEIEQLKQRLNFVAALLRDSSQTDTHFLLDPGQQAEFDRCLQTDSRAFLPKQLSKPTVQLARFVYWLGGLDSLKRFVSTMLVTNDPERQLLDLVDPISEWLLTLQNREPYEPRWVISYELTNNPTFKEFVEIASLKNIWKKVRRRCLSERLERYRSCVANIRNWARRKNDVEFPGTVAAWAVATESGSELPRRVAQQLRDSSVSEKLVARVEYLVGISGSAGYAEVINLLNSNDVCLTNNLIRKVGHWLHDGFPADDVLFCIKHLRLVSISRCVSPSAVRRGAERFVRLFGDSGIDWFKEIHGHIYSNQQVEAIDKVFQWMEKFSNFKLCSKMKDTITPALDNLKQLLELQGDSSDLVTKIHEWYGKAAAIAECYPDESSYPKQLRIWLRRLGYYQRLSDQKCAIPKSLRQSLLADKKRQEELNYLKSFVNTCDSTPQARQRFAYLSNFEFDKSKNERKCIREVQEACLLAGLGALRHRVVQESARNWINASRQPLHPEWSENRIVEIGRWTRRMGPSVQKFLRTILETHVENGGTYKLHLPFNQAWIQRMRCKGFAIDHWLAPPSRSTRIQEREVTISVSKDPYEIFKMGNYFGSCLSQGGCNEMAVLSNAADANKHVIYVRDLNGTVLARQLIAISRKNELLHYCLYVATKEISGEDSKELYRVEVDQFCREIARRVGIKLGCEGAPVSLANQFWYDDLAVAWKEEKKVKPAKEKVITSQVGLSGYFFVQPCWPENWAFDCVSLIAPRSKQSGIPGATTSTWTPLRNLLVERQLPPLF